MRLKTRLISKLALQTRLQIFCVEMILLLTLRISPQRAGYSLQELFLLSRSQLIRQRSLALCTLANILSKVHKQTQAVLLCRSTCLYYVVTLAVALFTP